MTRRHKGLVLFCLAVQLGIQIDAQSTFGSIVGTVQDQSQLVLPAASIQAKNLDDNSVYSAVAGNDGSFQLLNLKPGRYELRVQKPAFNDFVLTPLQLDSRQTVRVQATLLVASVGTSVEVADT